MQHCLSFRRFHSLDSHLGSTLDPLGSLQQPPAKFSNDLWSLHVVPTAQLPQVWEFFFFFILGLGFWIISMLETRIRNPPPSSGPSQRYLTFQCIPYMKIKDTDDIMVIIPLNFSLCKQATSYARSSLINTDALQGQMSQYKFLVKFTNR